MIQQLGAAVNWLSDQVRPYSFQVATAIVATLLFIYGESIHRFVRDKLGLKNKPFVIRLCMLIALCAFGYGALILLLSHIWITETKSLDTEPIRLIHLMKRGYCVGGISPFSSCS